MAGPLDTALTTYYLQDNVSTEAAATWNNPYHAIANLVDSHLDHAVSGATGQGGVAIWHHRDVDIVSHADYTGATNRTTAISPDSTSLNTIIDELIFAWGEMRGVNPNTFHSAAAPTFTIADLSAATNLTTPTSATIPKRDGSGGIQYTYIGIIPRTATADVALNVQGPTGWTGAYIQGTLNGVTKLLVDANGNMTLAGSLTVGASLFASLISDYRPGTSATLGHLSLAAGGAYTDSGGSQVGPLGTATDAALVSSVAQPSGSNSVYVAVSVPASWNGAAANLHYTASAPLAAPAKPTVPTGDWGVAMVLWRGPSATAGSGANPTGAILAADIADIRFPGGGGAGAGGGGTVDTNLRTSPFMSFGPTPYDGAAWDMSQPQTTPFIHPDNIHKAGQAPPSSVLRNMVQVDLLSRLTSPTGSVIQLLASSAAIQPGPFSADIGGARYTATSTLSADASTLAASQQVKLCLDITSGALALTFLGAATNPNSATQQVIQQYQLDAAKNLLPTPVANGATVTFTPWADNTPLGMVDSTQVRRRKIEIADNGAGVAAFTPGASFGTIAGVPSGVFPLPARSQGMIYARIWGTKTGGANPVYIAPLIDGGPVDATAFYELNTAYAGDFTIFMVFEIPPLNPLATHTIGLGFEHGGVGTDTISLYANGTKVWAIFDGI